jgi:hypothetical protein
MLISKKSICRFILTIFGIQESHVFYVETVLAPLGYRKEEV